MDTSAIFALADRNDNNHGRAVRLLEKLLNSGEELVMHNYIIVESVALLQRRLGTRQAKEFLNSAALVSIHWVVQESHAEARQYFDEHAGRSLSFVDCMSFVAMKEKGIKKALAFDDDFKRAGFELYE